MPASSRTARAEAGAAAETWRNAARALLAKAIGEFCYEGLLEPETDKESGDQEHYRLDLDRGVCYRFRADRGDYGSWFVDPASLRRAERGTETAPHDPLAFIADAQGPLQLPGDTAGHLIRELAATMAADACLERAALPSTQLAELSYAELEGHMAGHPWIVFNKGRFGFSASDALRYAPEARHKSGSPGSPSTPTWPTSTPSATSRRSAFTPTSWTPAPGSGSAPSWSATASTRRATGGSRCTRGSGTRLIQPLYGPEVAAGRIVPLGTPTDGTCRSSRSARSQRQPRGPAPRQAAAVGAEHDGVARPADRAHLAAPAVTAWLLGIADADPFLRDECKVILLGEVASVAVRAPGPGPDAGRAVSVQ